MTSVTVLGGAPDTLLRCGDGSPFPRSSLSGPQGAELDADGAARALSRAITDGSAGYLPRSGWIRVLDEPAEVRMVGWLDAPSPERGALISVVLQPATTDGTGGDTSWRVVSVGFCWPRPVLEAGMVALRWRPAGPVGAVDSSFQAIVDIPDCTVGGDPPEAGLRIIQVRVPGHLAIALHVPSDDAACADRETRVEVALPDPLEGRGLIDLATDPVTLVQPRTGAGGDGPVLSMEPLVRVDVDAEVVAVVSALALADSLDTGPRLVPVTVVDRLRLRVRLATESDLVLAGPPSVCLVGPHAAPDDAGLIDRCWGDPDLGAAVAAALPRTPDGWPVLQGGQTLEVSVDIGRGEVRCDFPLGDWSLETVIAPLIDGHGWDDLVLPERPLTLAAGWLTPTRELTRGETRYCGLAAMPDAPSSPSAEG